MKILLVDDDLHWRSSLESYLESKGYEVITASNGEQALEILLTYQDISLILLDLSMPVMTGWEFLNARKGNEALKQIPVIVQSGENNPQNLDSDLPYLSKPYKGEDLTRLISSIRASRRSA